MNIETIARITFLTEKIINDEGLSVEENAELEAFLAASPKLRTEFERRTDRTLLDIRAGLFLRGKASWRTRMEADLHKRELAVSRKRVIYRWRAVMAAAAVLLAVTGIAVLVPRQKKVEIPVNVLAKDLPPGGDKAILTLADGSSVVLDSVGNGAVASQGNSRVMKLDSGEIAYQPVDGGSAEVLYNKISTPRGGQYKLVLPDGSKVWLNAATVLRYPTAFSGAGRRVKLVTGEAYFEIKQDAARPFTVEVPSAQPGGKELDVEVLGTSFNVNAYPDEPERKASLLTGSVKVKRGGETVLLHPGEQALAGGDSQPITTSDQIDVAGIVAWKDGLFSFDRSSTEAIMRQLARWYDVEVSYEGKIPVRQFVGKISRNMPASDVLKLLELNNVHFRIEGKKIIVTQ